MKKQSFEKFNLDKEILKAIENLGFEKPSSVQEKAIPEILNNKDVIVKSKTGSGKTASFGIPMCQRVDIEDRFVQGIVLVPTRELALQVKEDISNIGRLKKIRCAAIFGKQPFDQQVRELKQRVHIVAGTPGRVMDHIERGNLKLDNVKFAVIDEGDKMLNMGFIDQIKGILSLMNKNRLTALFSATIPDEIEILCRDYMKSPIYLEIKSDEVKNTNIKQEYIEVSDDEKLDLLEKYIYSKAPEAAIVFCNTREKVKEVYSSLKRKKFLVAEIHGEMEQKDRIDTMERFKNKEFKILVATDVAARGIHIDHITHVFNYEAPMEKESYVHRIGRTGRAGKKGEAILLASRRDMKFLHQIEEYLGYSIEKATIPDSESILNGKEVYLESQRKFAQKTGVEKKKIHNEVMKIHINAGKKKKIRPMDILGCLSNIKGLTGEDIGIIDIQDGFSYVDILNNKGNVLLKNHDEISIKGKNIKIQRAKK